MSSSPERGAVSAMVIVLIVMLFAVAGLVYDGGRAINARQQTFDDVEQAARAGAREIDLGAFRGSGDVRLVEGSARQAAVAYLLGLDRGYEPARITVDVPPTGDEVEVVAERTVQTGLLQLVLVDTFDVEGRATAQPEIGILGGSP